MSCSVLRVAFLLQVATRIVQIFGLTKPFPSSVGRSEDYESQEVKGVILRACSNGLAMNVRLDLTDLDEVLLRAAHEGARLALAEQSSGSPWLSVKSAADYLDTTEDAIRALVKRRQVPHHRTETGRLLFRRDELDAFAQGEAA